MSTCMVFVFFSLMEYALVNVVLGDVPEDGPKPPQPTNKTNNIFKSGTQVKVANFHHEIICHFGAFVSVVCSTTVVRY